MRIIPLVNQNNFSILNINISFRVINKIITFYLINIKN